MRTALNATQTFLTNEGKVGGVVRGGGDDDKPRRGVLLLVSFCAVLGTSCRLAPIGFSFTKIVKGYV